MLENRNLKRDLFAIGLLAGVAFLGVSLVTYHPADPVQPPIAPLDQLYTPDQLVYPAHESVTNLCGNSGALVADAMLTGLGIGAYFVVASLAWVDLILLRRQGLQTPWIRSAGWMLTLVGMTTCLSLLVPSWSPGPIVGPGGYLGALVSGLLRTQFASFGAIILSLSLLACGLLLYTDYAILRVGKLLFTFSFVGVIAVQEWLQTRRQSRRLQPISNELELAQAVDTTGEEEIDEEEEEFSEPAIKISGRPKQVAATEEGEDETEEWEEEESLDADEEVEDVAEEEDEESADDEAESETEDELVVKAHKTKKPAPPKTVHQQPHFKVKKPEKNERDVVMHQLNEASRGELAQEYELPSIELLHDTEDFCFDDQEKEVRAKAKILEKTFAEFGFKVRVVEIETGPVIAQYEIQLEAGLRLSKITGLADDLAIALRVPSVRIVAPIPGKNTVGIEVPNEARQTVRLREVMELSEQTTKKMKIPLFLGKDVSGNSLCADLASLPHLLIAGRTGTGKSVCLNAIISSILMTRRPDEVRMLMIDPKMVELSGYGRLPHLMHPVVTDMKKAEAILAWAVEKMEERYALLAKAGVRHITTYNQLGEEELIKRLQPEDDDERAAIPLHLPFIVIVADEMADLMMTAGKEVEQHIIRLAQKSRAVGIHLILATQKPTVDVITGLIKSNLPARIAFQVASRTDSRVVLDEMGAEKLLGNGDMLFLWPGTSTLLRGQGTYLGDDEIDSITNEVSQGEQNFVNELVNLKVETTDEGAEDRFAQLKKRDELYESAIDIVVREGRGSVSLLQRALGIGYGRAARLIDFMAEDNIVGPYAGSQAREVLVSIEEWQTMQGVASKPPAPPKPARTNVIVPDIDEDAVDEDDVDEDGAEYEEDDVSHEYADDDDAQAFEDVEMEEDDADDESAEDVEDEVDGADAELDDDDEPSSFVPPPKSRTAQRRRNRTIRPHSDDDGDDPFAAPHWNESDSAGNRRGTPRRRTTRRAVSQVASAPWEDEVVSDWAVDTGDESATSSLDDGGAFPTAIDTSTSRSRRIKNQASTRIDSDRGSDENASDDDEGPRIVVGGRRRHGLASSAAIRRRAPEPAEDTSLWDQEDEPACDFDELEDPSLAIDDDADQEDEDLDAIDALEDDVEDEEEEEELEDADEDDALEDEYEEDEETEDDDSDEYEYEEEEADEDAEEEEDGEEVEDGDDDGDDDEYEYEYEYEEEELDEDADEEEDVEGEDEYEDEEDEEDDEN